MKSKKLNQALIGLNRGLEKQLWEEDRKFQADRHHLEREGQSERELKQIKNNGVTAMKDSKGQAIEEER